MPWKGTYVGVYVYDNNDNKIFPISENPKNIDVEEKPLDRGVFFGTTLAPCPKTYCFPIGLLRFARAARATRCSTR